MSRLGSFVDGVIADFSPVAAERRSRARALTVRNKMLETAYQSASPTMQRGSRSILTMSESGQLTSMQLDAIREWSRNTYRNNSLMSGMIRRAVDNIIGTGLIVAPMTNDSAFNGELKSEFGAYVEAGGDWDAERKRSFAVGQREVLISAMRDGDLLMYRADEGWQFFEGGQIGTPTGYDTKTTRIHSGIQVNALNRPSYYWVSDYSENGYIDPRTAQGLRADKCRLVGNFEWLTQMRGMPIYQNALGRFEDLDRYLEAELLGAMAAACIMGEINSPSTTKQALGALTPNSDKTKLDPTNGVGRQVELMPAQIIHTYENEKFTLHHAQRPGASFPEYIRSNLRILGMPIGLPLEIGTLDFSQTNFAAAKMAIVQAMLTFLFWQDTVVVDQFVRPVYVDWYRTKRTTQPKKSVLRAENFEVQPPKSGWLDPYKEALAINAGIEGGWDNITRVAKEEMNRTLEDILDERVQEILLAKTKADANGIADYREVLYGRSAFKPAELPAPETVVESDSK